MTKSKRVNNKKSGRSARELAIIGAGGHGRVVEEVACLSGKYGKIVFYDDDEEKQKRDSKIKGSIKEVWQVIRNTDIFVALGDNQLRKQMIVLLMEAGAHIPTLIHPSAVISPSAKIGFGSVVMANAVINSLTEIGKGVIVNTGATVDHENIIQDYCHISVGSHLAGNVTIGPCSLICIGACVSNHVRIGQQVIIGAGSVVLKDITEKGTYIGIPARKLKAVI